MFYGRTSWTLGHFLAQYFYSRNKKNVSTAALTDFQRSPRAGIIRSFSEAGKKSLNISLSIFSQNWQNTYCLVDNKHEIIENSNNIALLQRKSSSVNYKVHFES